MLQGSKKGPVPFTISLEGTLSDQVVCSMHVLCLCFKFVQESLTDEKFKNILYRIEEFKRQLDRVSW